MVGRSSRVDHVILESHYILKVMYGCTDWESNGELKCDRMRSSQIQSGLICETAQVGEFLRGVGEVMQSGSKHGRLNGTQHWEQIVTVPPPKVLSPCEAGLPYLTSTPSMCSG